MELIISIKGNKYTVQDKEKGRTIYTVKKKGFGAGRYVLMDTSNYNLYSIVQTSGAAENAKPTFTITHNERSMMRLSCKSKFLDPTITVEGKDLSNHPIKYSLASKDHRNFEILRDDDKVGSVTTQLTMANELQYEMEIENKIFDDYIPLFVVAIDLTFGEINKNA